MPSAVIIGAKILGRRTEYDFDLFLTLFGEKGSSLLIYCTGQTLFHVLFRPLKPRLLTAERQTREGIGTIGALNIVIGLKAKMYAEMPVFSVARPFLRSHGPVPKSTKTASPSFSDLQSWA